MSGQEHKPKRPADLNRLALSIVADATSGQETDANDRADGKAKPEKNPAAVALGRLGGLKGGRSRALSLSAEERSAIAKKAARARWNKIH